MVPSLDADAAAVSRALAGFVTAPLRPQTYRNAIYVLLAFPLGIAYLVLVSVGLGVGLGLVVVVVGIPVLGALVLAALAAAGFERRLARFFLGVEVDGSASLAGETRRDRAVSLLTDVRTYTPLVYLPAKFLVGNLALVVATTTLTTGVSMLLMPLYFDQPGVYVGLVTDRPVELHPALYIGWNNLLVGVEAVVSLGYWKVRTLGQALVVAGAGLVVCLLGVNALNVLARLTGWVTEKALAGGYDPLSAAFGGANAE